MLRKFQKWTPIPGEEISGRILYFESAGSFAAIVRTKNRYLILPREARNLFLLDRPPDGAQITIRRGITCYQLLPYFPQQRNAETPAARDAMVYSEEWKENKS